MMYMRRIIISISLIFIALLLPVSLRGQQLLWDVDLKFGFDNREYASLTTSPSGTIFGAMLSPKVGLGFGEGHAVYAGVDATRYFGKSAPALMFDYLLYYQYDGDRFKVNAGAFPRKRMTGYYPEAFFDDRFFFDGSLEGTLLSYTGKFWRMEGAVDWVGLMDDDTREQFLVYSYGCFGVPWLSLSYSFMMNHYANSASFRGGVVDNVWIYPHLSSDVSEFLPQRMTLALRAGWMQTFQNDRYRKQGYVLPGGFQGEVEFGYYGFGVRNTVYAGKNLMPFYGTEDIEGNPYGSGLYYGDVFYSTDSGIYNRLEISYKYDFRDFLSLKVASVHHYDGYGWGWQQLIQLVVNLNNFQFPVKSKADNPHHHHR